MHFFLHSKNICRFLCIVITDPLGRDIYIIILELLNQIYKLHYKFYLLNNSSRFEEFINKRILEAGEEEFWKAFFYIKECEKGNNDLGILFILGVILNKFIYVKVARGLEILYNYFYYMAVILCAYFIIYILRKNINYIAPKISKFSICWLYFIILLCGLPYL